jgi:prepilin-type N-terminal cleavage/methylation domain-containing protein
MFNQLAQGNKGFTLIEVLVSIVIIGIGATVAAPSFVTWLDNNKVDNALAQVEGAIKEAQSTSVRINQICRVTIEQTEVTATPSGCLPTGARNLQTQGLQWSNANIETTGSGVAARTVITFSPRGTTPVTDNDAVVVVHRRGAQGSRMKCLVISSGVGMIRVGNFQANNSPSFSNPPTATEIVDAIANCKTTRNL